MMKLNSEGFYTKNTKGREEFRWKQKEEIKMERNKAIMRDRINGRKKNREWKPIADCMLGTGMT